MNSIGKIVVHLDDSPKGDLRLQLGRQVALMLTQPGVSLSAIEAVYATTPSYLVASMGYSEFSAGTVAMLMEADGKRGAQAQARFNDWASANPGLEIVWQSLPNEAPGASLMHFAWLADLLVLGQHDPSDASMSGVPRNFIANLLVDSGKPGLIVPYIGLMKSTLQTVLIAWKATRESSRALVASIPFLQRAKAIHVLADVPSAENGAFSRRFEAYLRSNGITASIGFHSSVGIGAGGEGMLSAAADVSADLLVMGCYGHSRTREFVLGGASRTILQSMTLPVLMAH
jgi:nucleotide-binding universal stress UspA family protein